MLEINKNGSESSISAKIGGSDHISIPPTVVTFKGKNTNYEVAQISVKCYVV